MVSFLLLIETYNLHNWYTAAAIIPRTTAADCSWNKIITEISEIQNYICILYNIYI